tara:strand:- start:1024 stop:1188 length:165 start_codon:yes stop_codon:yes gene_type:complete
MEKENKNYSVSVWDIQFYMVDEDGNEKLNKEKIKNKLNKLNFIVKKIKKIKDIK